MTTRVSPFLLANTAVEAGVYGGSSQIPVITIDAQGRATHAQNVFVTIPPSTTIYANTGQLTANAATGNVALGLAETTVSPGSYTYSSITVDAYGRLTAASSGANAQAAFDVANTAAANTVVIQGVDLAQNTYISNVEQYAQSAYNAANGKFSSSGGFISGDTVVTGNLTVNGTTFYANVTNVLVEDNIFILNSNVTGTPTQDAGIEVNRGNQTNTSILWIENAKQWEITNDGTNFDGIVTNGSLSSNVGYLQGVNTSQNTYINHVEQYSQSAYAAANAAGSSAYVQSAFDKANTASSNTIIIQGVDVSQNTRMSVIEGVDLGQNTYITNVEHYAQAAYAQANAANNLAQAAFNLANTESSQVYTQAAFDKANTASANTIIIQGVDLSQNTRMAIIEGVDLGQNTYITSVEQYAESAYAQANTNASNISIIQGVDVSQNTRMSVIEGVDLGQNTLIGIIQGVDLTQNTRLSVIEGVDLGQNTHITNVEQYAESAYAQANTNSSNISALQGVDNSQNTHITNVESYAQSGYSKANTNADAITVIQGVDLNQNTHITNVEQYAESSYALANTNFNNISIIQGVDNTQNTHITNVEQYSQFGYAQANAANNMAQAAYNQANTNASNIQIIQGVNVSQNTYINNVEHYTQGSYALANTNAGNINIIQGVDLWQNTYIAAVESYAQGAYYNSNTKFSSSGGSITGNVTIHGNLDVTGNVMYTGNVTTVLITGQTGEFFGYEANGFNALYAGIPAGYSIEPQTIVQTTGNYNNYIQINLQNINHGSNASGDIVVTADNGNANDTYIDMGINSSTYNQPGYGLTGPNDGYLYVAGNTSTGGGNLVLSTYTNNDIIFSTNGGDTPNEVMRINAANSVVIKSTNASNSVTTGALQVAGGVGIQGDVQAQKVFSNGIDIVSYFNGIDSSQNTHITNVEQYSQSGYAKANAVNNYSYSAYAQANTNAGNISIIQGVDVSQNTRLSIIEGVDLGQNTYISNVEHYSQSAYAQANATNGLTTSAYAQANAANNMAQGAYNVANTASANTIIIQGVDLSQNTRMSVIEGVDLGQNTYIGNVEHYAQAGYNQANITNSYAQSGYAQANSANNMAVGAYSLANTHTTQIAIIQGVDLGQNTYITNVEHYAQAAYAAANAAGSSAFAQAAFDKANTASANTIYTQGVDTTQNNNIIAVNNFAQSSYNVANAAATSAQLAWNTANTASSANAVLTCVVDTFTANGLTSSFVLSTTPTNINYTTAVVNGVNQPRSAYSVIGTTITFTSTPSNTSIIEVTTIGTSNTTLYTVNNIVSPFLLMGA